MTLRHGYFTGTGYTYGAYSEPSPERLALLCLLRGQRPPDLSAPFRSLELGCGQGVHLCLQAANYPQAQFLGIDVHPDHIAHARSLAAAAGLENIAFRQEDFLDLERNPAALNQEFDLVTAHGILSWVSPRVGSVLMRLAAAALRPGGLFYVSYNTLPGWLASLPLQHTIRSLQGRSRQGIAAVEATQNLFRALKDVGAQVFDAQPGLAPRLEGLIGKDPSYLVHEYNHSEWQPLYANQVIEAALEQSLSFLGSATLADNFDGLLPKPYSQLLQQQSEPALKELVRDLLTNQSFRRDVYVKGSDPLWTLEALARLDELRLMRVVGQEVFQEDDAFHFPLGFGEVQGSRDWFLALMRHFSDQPLVFADLRARMPTTLLPELLQNLVLLIAKGILVVVPPERDPQPAHRFNALIAERVAAGAPYRSLACPVSGNIHALSDTDLLLFHASLKGHRQSELVEILDQALRALQWTPTREDQSLEGEARQEALMQLSQSFSRTTRPLLERLGVIG